MSLPPGQLQPPARRPDAWDARSAPVREHARQLPDLASSRFSAPGCRAALENAVAERIGHPRPSERTPGLF